MCFFCSIIGKLKGLKIIKIDLKDEGKKSIYMCTDIPSTKKNGLIKNREKKEGGLIKHSSE